MSPVAKREFFATPFNRPARLSRRCESLLAQVCLPRPYRLPPIADTSPAELPTAQAVRFLVVVIPWTSLSTASARCGSGTLKPSQFIDAANLGSLDAELLRDISARSGVGWSPGTAESLTKLGSEPVERRHHTLIRTWRKRFGRRGLFALCTGDELRRTVWACLQIVADCITTVDLSGADKLKHGIEESSVGDGYKVKLVAKLTTVDVELPLGNHRHSTNLCEAASV